MQNKKEQLNNALDILWRRIERLCKEHKENFPELIIKQEETLVENAINDIKAILAEMD